MVSMTTGISLGVLELDGRPLSLEQIHLVENPKAESATGVFRVQRQRKFGLRTVEVRPLDPEFKRRITG